MWNRSSAFSPETIAIINTATAKAVQDAIHIFESALGDVTLSDEERAAAILMLARGVTDGIAEFVETLKK
jgi:hypothetical protein